MQTKKAVDRREGLSQAEKLLPGFASCLHSVPTLTTLLGPYRRTFWEARARGRRLVEVLSESCY